MPAGLEVLLEERIHTRYHIVWVKPDPWDQLIKSSSIKALPHQTLLLVWAQGP